jgi:hypothetical protein
MASFVSAIEEWSKLFQRLRAVVRCDAELPEQIFHDSLGWFLFAEDAAFAVAPGIEAASSMLRDTGETSFHVVMIDPSPASYHGDIGVFPALKVSLGDDLAVAARQLFAGPGPDIAAIGPIYERLVFLPESSQWCLVVSRVGELSIFAAQSRAIAERFLSVVGSQVPMMSLKDALESVVSLAIRAEYIADFGRRMVAAYADREFFCTSSPT